MHIRHFETSIITPFALTLALAVACLLAGSCKGEDTKAPDKKPATSPPAGTGGAVAPPATEKAPVQPEKDPPFHVSKPDHESPRDPAPPAPKRAVDADVVTGKKTVTKVSDITIMGAKTGTVSIEVQPRGLWKYNTDFPTRVTLEGTTVASPPAAVLKSSAPDATGFQTTSGGLRVDIPFTGDAPGTDEVVAKVRLGLCSKTTCIVHTDSVAFRVTVETP